MGLFNFGKKKNAAAPLTAEDIFLGTKMEEHIFEKVFDYLENGSTGAEYLARWDKALELAEKRLLGTSAR